MRKVSILSILLLILCCAISLHGAKKKVKLHDTSHTSHYGHDLPHFAFDYSELFLGATIERVSSSKDLYLTILMLSHDAIFTTGFIDAVSTEEEQLLAWTEAIKKWKRHYNDTQIARSKFFCVLQNTEESKSLPYQAPAYWLKTYINPVTSHIPTPVRSFVEILRCKLKYTHTVHANHTYSTTHRLLVDLVRGAGGVGDSAGGAHAKNKSSTTHMDSKGVGTNRTVVSSFEVAWKNRQVGVASPSVRAGSLSLWSLASADGVKSGNANANSNLGWERKKTRKGVEADTKTNSSSTLPVVHACVAGTKGQAVAGLAEVVEGLVQSGVSHIHLGVELHESSYTLAKLLLTLSPYLLSSQLSISPLSAPAFEHLTMLQGPGLVLHPRTSRGMFLTQCLYRGRGIADFMLMLTDGGKTLIPAHLPTAIQTSLHFSPSSGLVDMPHLSIFSTIHAQSTANAHVHSTASILRNNTVQSSYLRHHHNMQHKKRTARSKSADYSPRSSSRRLADAHTSNASTSSHSSNKGLVMCALRLDRQYAVADPPHAFFGPPDNVWFRDFYASSPMHLLPTTYAPIRLLSTRYANAVIVTDQGEVVPICKGGKGVMRVAEKVMADVQAVRFVDSIPSVSNSNRSPEKGKEKSHGILQNLVDILNPIHSGLHKLNRSSLTYLEMQWKELAQEFRQRGEALVAKSSSDIKEPYWRSCKTKSLAEVMSNVFG